MKAIDLIGAKAKAVDPSTAPPGAREALEAVSVPLLAHLTSAIQAALLRVEGFRFDEAKTILRQAMEDLGLAVGQSGILILQAVLKEMPPSEISREAVAARRETYPVVEREQSYSHWGMFREAPASKQQGVENAL